MFLSRQQLDSTVSALVICALLLPPAIALWGGARFVAEQLWIRQQRVKSQRVESQRVKSSAVADLAETGEKARLLSAFRRRRRCP